MKDVKIRHAHQTIVIGNADPQTADFLQIALGAPTAECRWWSSTTKGVAIYVADITYRSEVIKLHIDLLANSRGPQRRSDELPAAGRDRATTESRAGPPSFAVAIAIILKLAS